jgi:ATP-dependent DNA helicase RecQ
LLDDETLDELMADDLAGFIEQQAGPGIVYARARKTCELVASLLADRGVAAVAYHAGLSDRSRTQSAWIHSDEPGVIVATVAFGMGVNKSNVRFVAHWNLPTDLGACVKSRLCLPS